MLKTRYEIPAQRSDTEVPVTIDSDGQGLTFTVPGGPKRQSGAVFTVAMEDMAQVLAAIGASTPKDIQTGQDAPPPKRPARQRKPPAAVHGEAH